LLPVFVVGKVSLEVDPEIKSREPIGESARGDRWRADYECAVFQSAEEFQSNLIKEGVVGNNSVHEKTRDTYPASHDSGNTWQLQTGSLRDILWSIAMRSPCLFKRTRSQSCVDVAVLLTPIHHCRIVSRMAWNSSRGSLLWPRFYGGQNQASCFSIPQRKALKYLTVKGRSLNN